MAKTTTVAVASDRGMLTFLSAADKDVEYEVTFRGLNFTVVREAGGGTITFDDLGVLAYGSGLHSRIAVIRDLKFLAAENAVGNFDEVAV